MLRLREGGVVRCGEWTEGALSALSPAPEAPEFSNSLFNSFGNLGLTGGTMIGGLFIAFFGIRVLPLASIALLAVAGLVFLLERRLYAGRGSYGPRSHG